MTASQIAGGINLKLADYVFFPLSNVLRQLEKLPEAAKELTLRCISQLLMTAWGTGIAAPLGVQLMILLSFVADANDKSEAQLSSEELLSIALTCLGQDFDSLAKRQEGRDALTSAEHIPHVGKCMSVILDNIYGGPSVKTQAAAIYSLKSLINAIQDDDALALSFLPGIVSCFTKVLKSASTTKRSSESISMCLEIMTSLCLRLFGNDSVRKLPPSVSALPASTGRVRDQAWLTATSPQIHSAMTVFVKQRHHDRQVVRRSLADLCVAVLDHCNEALAQSKPMMLETMVRLANDDDQIYTDLRVLLDTNTDLSNVLSANTLTWTTSLPRIMLSTDESSKTSLLENIILSRKLLKSQQIDTTSLDGAILSSARDCIAQRFNLNKHNDHSGNPMGQELVSQNYSLDFAGNRDFPSVIYGEGGGKDGPADALLNLIQDVSRDGWSPSYIRSSISAIPDSLGSEDLSKLWMALQYVQSTHSEVSGFSDFLVDQSITSTQNLELIEELYSYSVGLITEGSDVSRPWQAHAIALEVIALQARRQGLDFQPELVDVLYPILVMMGSSVPQLSEHAITCLNIITEACGAKDAGTLIVENVDYLVNAVALRLNSFDIAPQAPLVMIMMIKLTGPSLLPYLDDLVDSIFTTLESFHGYVKLVQMLFGVFQAVIEEGVKTPLLVTASDTSNPTIAKTSVKIPQISQLVTAIESLAARARQTAPAESEDHGNVPQEPWGKSKDEAQTTEDEAADSAVSETKNVDDKPPAPRVYSLLLKVAQLTQHHMSASAPELRSSLLALLHTVIPALAKHENSFLPFIHTIWPVLVHRTEDPEAYVVAAALKVIESLVQHAGDFVKSRIEELWPYLRQLLQRRILTMNSKDPIDITSLTKKLQIASITKLVSSKSIGSATDNQQHFYVQAPTRLLWNSLVSLLSRIVTEVPITEGTFDEMLEVLLPVVEQDGAVRSALETRNPDAVWLALYKNSTSMRSEVKEEHPLGERLESLVRQKGWSFVTVG